MLDAILVGSGAFVGGNARYWLARWVAERYGTSFPYGTMVINITGSFVIGLLLAFLLARSSLSPNYRLVFVVGFLGAYTTFSTYAYDTYALVESGNLLRALLYFAGSGLLGMMAVTVGVFIGRAIS